MRKALKDAVAEAATLPEADQEKMGRELLAHVEKLRALRTDIEAGLRSLDAGDGKPLDVEDVIRRARGLSQRPCVLRLRFAPLRIRTVVQGPSSLSEAVA